ncbi:MAG TPA: MSMEG_0569 family flavin-dependent oxidoreductase [Streptosporangiaceae bacterium]
MNPQGQLHLDGAQHNVVVIGGGQAGLSMSYCLGLRGIDHLVLDKATVGNEWRDRRWDSFCLVTPNWQCELPGFPYQGPEPHGFMLRDEIVSYLESYARSFGPPLAEHTTATRLTQRPRGGFEIRTSRGMITADQVVVATGPYQVPLTPRLGHRLPDDVRQIHSSQYRNPAELPPGAVLVVGTGQSGGQIAEDLHLAGRTVHLATGSAPRVTRFYRGRDVVDWLADMGYYARGIEEFSDADAVRFRANHYVTGRDGGRDIDLRAFARDGMRLYGRLAAVRGGTVHFADDLRENLDRADAVAESIKDSIDAHIDARRIVAPREARYAPVWEPAGLTSALDLEAAGIATVIWATGFGRDCRWIEVPVFDGRGYPTHRRGVTSCEGLYFLGLPWQHTWGSGRFCGVGTDAAYLADRICAGPLREVHWLAGTPASTWPRDEDWAAPRTVA